MGSGTMWDTIQSHWWQRRGTTTSGIANIWPLLGAYCTGDNSWWDPHTKSGSILTTQIFSIGENQGRYPTKSEGTSQPYQNMMWNCSTNQERKIGPMSYQDAWILKEKQRR